MITLFNTYSRKKEVFNPQNLPLVTMYNCGPTVYNYAHIGNLRGYVNAHILRNILEYHSFEVRQVINITDVGHLVSDGDEGEDKIEKGARRESKDVEEIIQHYTTAFLENLKDLHINPDNVYAFPRATHHIPEQISLIQTLEEKGFTYTIDDGVYFDTSKYPDYAVLAKLDLDNLKEGARTEINTQKRNISDFALWKFSGEEARLQEWDSPWGVGFPGWHIECSAMAMKYLGETLDIHTGGIDHVPVHHTNEIAQSTCATGKEFSRFWVHHEFVNIKDGKMSKSSENFITLETLKEKGFSPSDYTYLLLQTHYRSPVTFSFESLEASRNALDRIIRIYNDLPEEETNPDPKILSSFMEILRDDIDTPEALSFVWEYIKNTEESPSKKATLRASMKILGIDLEILTQETFSNIPEHIKTLAEERLTAKKEGLYEKADTLREEIASQGFIIQDSKEGYTIEKK